MAPSTTSLLAVLSVLSALSWSEQGGPDAAVPDCDEVFNYLDPLHFAVHGRGQQTWEYSPSFALRSWAYIEAFGVWMRGVAGWGRGAVELDGLRIALTLGNLAAEARLCRALGERWGGDRTAWMAAGLMGLSTGMGHARRALLPSSTCMTCFTLALGEWIMGRHASALASGALAVLAVWPFAALPFVPIGLDALHQRGMVFVIKVGLASLVAFGALPALVDSWYYAKPVWPTLQMVLYNALGASGGGAHLYGVETFSYYPKNLFLNFNVLVGVFAASMITTSKSKWMFLISPVLLHMALFQSMPHKEERFLFVVYPALCASSAVFLSENMGAGTWKKRGVVLVLGAFVALTVSRNLALGRLDAPSWVMRRGFTTTNTHVATQEKVVLLCLGREWYRFPSSFYLPPGVELAYVESGFQGILPQAFTPKSHAGYSRIPPHMNDMNRKEPSRFVDPAMCAYTMDSNEPPAGEGHEDVLQPFADPKTWKPLACRDLADLNASKQPYRSFALPWDPFQGVVKRRYCLFERVPVR